MKRTDWVLRWKALRAFSFPLSLLPVLVATAAKGRPATWDLPFLAASLWGVLCLHAFGNVVNDYFDHAYGVDHRVEEDDGRPGRLLVTGLLKPRDYALLAGGALLALAPVATWILYHRGRSILPYGLAALALAWAYTGPPFRMKHRGLGELAIFLVFGPLLVCGAAAPCDLRIFLLSLLIGGETTAVLVSNDLRDFEEDRQGGAKNLAHVLGKAACSFLFSCLLLLPPLFILISVLLRFLPPLCLLSLASLLIHLPLIRSVHRGERLPDVDARVAMGVTVFFAALFLGLVVVV